MYTHIHVTHNLRNDQPFATTTTALRDLFLLPLLGLHQDPRTHLRVFFQPYLRKQGARERSTSEGEGGILRTLEQVCENAQELQRERLTSGCNSSKQRPSLPFPYKAPPPSCSWTAYQDNGLN